MEALPCLKSSWHPIVVGVPLGIRLCQKMALQREACPWQMDPTFEAAHHLELTSPPSAEQYVCSFVVDIFSQRCRKQTFAVIRHEAMLISVTSSAASSRRSILMPTIRDVTNLH